MWQPDERGIKPLVLVENGLPFLLEGLTEGDAPVYHRWKPCIPCAPEAFHPKSSSNLLVSMHTRSFLLT